MTAARNAKPVPASITVSVFASAVRGTTSPKPSVKNVVPLMYTSDQNPGAPPPPSPTTRIAEPAAHCSRPKENTLPTAQRASNRINERGPKIERKTSRLRPDRRSEEHTSELQSHSELVCRLLLDNYPYNPHLHSFPTRRSSDLTSDQNPGAPPPPSPTTRIAEPAAHCSRAKENTLPTAQRASNRINERGPKIERKTSRLRPDRARAAARHGIHVAR